MEKPLVSVIIPSYNHGKYIRVAIESVLNQTYSNFELLISDDGSVDNSEEAIKSFEDIRIKAHFFRTHVGQKTNIENCIKRAKGKYLAVLPSDDIWELTKLEKQVTIMENDYNLGAVFTYADLIDESGNKISEEHHLYGLFNVPRTHAELIRQFFYGGNCLAAMSSFMRMDFAVPLFQSGIYLRQLGDFEIWVKLAKKAPIHIIPEKLVSHRRRKIENQSNMSAETPENMLRNNNEFFLIIRDFFDDMPEKLFIEAFSDLVIKKGKLNREEILCEHIFLYLTNGSLGSNGRIIASEKILQLSRDPKALSVLENTYGFMQEDFYYLTSTYYIGNSIGKKKFDMKFDGLCNILRNDGNKVAVYCPDARFTERLLDFFQDNDVECFKKIICLISNNPDRYNGKSYKGIPIVTLEKAIIDYHINYIIIASFEYQESLYQYIRHYENKGIKIKKIFSNIELMLDEYE